MPTSRELQNEVDDFIVKSQTIAAAAIAFMGEQPDDMARANIRRLQATTAALTAALQQAGTWANQSFNQPQSPIAQAQPTRSRS